MREKKKYPPFFKEDLKKLSQFGFQKMGDFTKDDVFIVGYPKSGNTLLQHVVAHLVFGLQKGVSKSIINSCVTEYYNNPWFFRHNPQHFFKSHELPNKEFKKVVYIVRDGREAIRSYFYMLQNLNQKVSLENLYKSGGDSFVGTWASHIDAWQKNPFKANIFWVKYEDLITNKKKVLENLCYFLSLDRKEEEIHQVVEATSLQSMKNMEKGFSWQRSKSFKTWKEDASFVREGKAKGFLEDPLIKKEWIKEFEDKSEKILKQFNYLP